MHFIENYSLLCGLKISKPKIEEEFLPLPFTKYITFSPFVDEKVKNYDYWQEVVDIIKPVLEEKGIQILQIGRKDDKGLKKVYHIPDLNINKISYLINNSILHLSVDSFSVYIASALSKKIVALYSVSDSASAGPFWSKKEDVVLFDSDKKGGKPSYSNEENPKTINTIKPEKIAKGVLDLLDVKNELSYETVFVGRSFHNKLLEVIPDSFNDLSKFNAPNLILRADLHFNSEAIEENLKVYNCIIKTKQPIDLDLFRKYKDKINGVVYFIDEYGIDIDFVEELKNFGTQYSLVTEEEDEDALNKLKLKTLNFNQMAVKKVLKKENFLEFKDERLSDLKYKSNKFLVSNGKIYPSEKAWRDGAEMEGFIHTWRQVEDSEDFWSEVENFHVVKNLK